MRSHLPILSFFILVSGIARGQEAYKVNPLHPHPAGGVSMSGGDHESLSIQSPMAASSLSPAFLWGAPAGNIYMAHFGDSVSTCKYLTMTRTVDPKVLTPIYSVIVPLTPGSTYVDVTFSATLSLYPKGGNAVGAAVDIKVEQDLDLSGNFASSYFVSGITSTLKPWLVFDPNTAPVGSSHTLSYRGYAPVVGLTTGGALVPTRVVVSLVGVEATSGVIAGGKVLACVNTLKVMY